MNDQLQKSAADLLDAARNAGQDGIAFLQKQAPDVCEQLVKLKLIENSLGFAASIILIIVSIFLLYKGYKISKNDRYGCDSMPLYVFGGFIGTISIIVFSNTLSNILECIYAPKAVIFNMIFHSSK